MIRGVATRSRPSQRLTRSMTRDNSRKGTTAGPAPSRILPSRLTLRKLQAWALRNK